MKKIIIKFNILLFILLFICVLNSPLMAENIKLLILSVNDTHGYISPFVDKNMKESDGKEVGGMAYLASLVREERLKYQGSGLLLNAGDLFQGTPVSNIFKGEPVVKIMNEMRFDATTLGNNEFDWGMQSLFDVLKEAKFDILCANIESKENFALFSLIRPYKIYQINGVRIGVIGVITDLTPSITVPENVNGLEFKKPADTLKKLIPVVKAGGADIVIVLSHCGFDEDRELAKKVKGIDLIIGGHSHTPVKKPVYVGKTIISQAGCYSEYLSKIVLNYDKDSKKISLLKNESYLIPVVDNISNIVSFYEKKAQKDMDQVIGYLNNDLERKSGKIDYPLANFICDIINKKAESQICFENNGGIRASLNKGEVRMKDAFMVLPFENAIVSMDLTGKDILDIMEKALGSEGRGMQVSGLTIKFDSTRPDGEKVVEMLAGNERLDFDKIYRVSVNNFLSEGGDNYVQFKNGKNKVSFKRDNGRPFLVRDALIEYIKVNSPVTYNIQGRITDLAKVKEEVK